MFYVECYVHTPLESRVFLASVMTMMMMAMMMMMMTMMMMMIVPSRERLRASGCLDGFGGRGVSPVPGGVCFVRC